MAAIYFLLGVMVIYYILEIACIFSLRLNITLSAILCIEVYVNPALIT